MFLRQIQMRGFKSFADKTVLEFIPGVSVIVGPNGSGKSNLVDAISWALGEQGPRALRGGQMADVIFAGTPSRPALGMAEVKLVIDNEAGLIPVPLTEIEVSRSIFRSGESEYRINGKLVRLLDLQELLAESGIGRALHTVVGQGQLEEVLLSRPEERRKYIEEAAGIAKHRRRKERAERKLAGLEQDLLRLQDVMSELKRQLKPLRQQAEMAKKHEGLTAQAEELSRKLAAARLRALLAERERRSSGWDEGLTRRKEARELLDELDGEVLAGADERAAAARKLADAELRFRSAQADRTQAEQLFRGAVDREAEARQALASHAGRAARLDSIEAELARVEADLTRTIEELAQREREREEAEAAFGEADHHRREVDELRRRAGEEAAGRRVETDALERAISSGEREHQRSEAELRDARDRIGALENEREEIEADIERLDGQSSPLADRRGQLEAERRKVIEKVEELEEIERRQQARVDLLEARRRDIEETAGSRFLKTHRGRAAGVLRDLVRAQGGLQRALVSALGPLADAVVYENRSEALAVASEGDGAILAIAAGGPVPQGLPGERPLLSAVDADPAARGIVSTVLRDVYLAGSIEEAAEKQAANPRASFVTPDGTLVGPAVIHTPKERDARAREIRAELQVVAHDLSGTRGRLKPQRQRLEETAEEIEFLGQQIEADDADITTAAERLGTLERELAAHGKEEELLAGRLASVRDAQAVARERLAALGPMGGDEIPELPPIPQPPVQARVAVETLRRDRSSLDARLARVRAERDEASTYDPRQLRAELEGGIEGPTVVLCNGLGVSPWCWPALLHADCGVRVVSWNHRGTGGSARPQDPDRVGIEEFVEDALSVMDHFGVDRAVLMGWSMGVNTAFELASRHPERVTGIFAVAGVPGDTFATMLGPFRLPHAVARRLTVGLSRALRTTGRAISPVTTRLPVGARTVAALTHSGFMLPTPDSELTARAVREFLAVPVEWFFHLALRSSEHARVSLSRVKVPVMLVAATYDVLAGARDMRSAADRLDDATYVELRASHFVQMEQPEVVHDLLLAFLSDISLSEIRPSHLGSGAGG